MVILILKFCDFKGFYRAFHKERITSHVRRPYVSSFSMHQMAAQTLRHAEVSE